MITYSIIKKSELEGAHRLDAEYYQPEYLEIAKLLRRNEFHHKLSDIISGGNYGTLPDSEDYLSSATADKDSIYLVRGVDLRGIFINENDLVEVPPKYLRDNVTLKEGDIIFLVKGATIDSEDSVSVVPKLSKPALFNGSIFRPFLKKDILPEYLYVYMRTKFFYMQKRRLVSNVGIEYNSISEIKDYDFIIPELQEQQNTKKIVKNIFSLLENSKHLYSQAENLLLEELGLKNFKAEEDLYSIVNFSDIKSVNRMDAEYFQPKYAKIISVSRKHGGKALGELVTIKKGFEPGADAYEDEGKLFIRVSSISKHELIDKDQKYISNKLYEELKKEYEPKKGEILLTKDASPGVAYVLDTAVEGIISSGILRLKLKEDINPDYLALCINSVVGQMQVERDAGGSIIAHWKPEQVKNLLIPILSKTTQDKIAELVRASHEARKKSKELLEEAKRKVEEMIEK